MIIQLQDQDEDITVDVPVFPSVGCLPVKPVRGEMLRVTGNLGMYFGRPQLRPLSASHVAPPTPRGNPVSVAAAAERVGETLLVGPVTLVSSEFFESRAGLRHLRLTLGDAGANAPRSAAQVAGIMFEGEQTACEVARLRSKEPVLATVKVGLYQGVPSLSVLRVIPVDAWQ